MDVSSVNSTQVAQSTQSSSAQTGVAAAQTDAQRLDTSAQRVVSVSEKARVEENASNAEEKKFQAVKNLAAKFVEGENPFLRDMSFTIYNNAGQNPAGNYEIRFTKISTGQIEIKRDFELPPLVGSSSSGNIVSGNI